MPPQIKRPQILIKAAKIGLRYYKRETGLKRLLHCNQLPSPEQAIPKLVDAEAALNEERKAKSTNYSLDRHITLLTALLNEMCLLERKSI